MWPIEVLVGEMEENCRRMHTRDINLMNVEQIDNLLLRFLVNDEKFCDPVPMQV